MDEPTDEGGLPDQSRAQELSQQFGRFIIGAVAIKFGVSPEKLELLHDLSVQFPDDPGKVYFQVLDRQGNTMYGVIARLQEDGTLVDYHCDIIPL